MSTNRQLAIDCND